MEHKVGIICNGITGRQGRHQHLNALVEIRDSGGVEIAKGEKMIPELMLVGRDESKLSELCDLYQIEFRSTDFLGSLSNPRFPIYLDSQITAKRYDCLVKAIRMGKVTLSEMPLVFSKKQAVELAKLAKDNGVKGGVVHNMMFLPGIIKLQALLEQNFFGKILRASISYSYWLPDGKYNKIKHPKWIFCKEQGGIIRDFFGHVRYLLENTVGKIITIQCLSSTSIKQRYDSEGNAFDCSAEDNAAAIIELEDGILARVSASWTTRTSELDIFTFQVDGTHGSAIATTRNCYIQPAALTPLPVWDPQNPSRADYLKYWHVMPESDEYPSVYKMLWESFIKYVYTNTSWSSNLDQAIRDVAFIDAALMSAQSGKKHALTTDSQSDG